MFAAVSTNCDDFVIHIGCTRLVRALVMRPLEECRCIANMHFLFKFVKNLVDCPDALSNINFNTNSKTRKKLGTILS